MKAIRNILRAALMSAALLAAAPVLAQHTGHEHGAQASNAVSDTVDGEIRKVDKASGKLTIKHAELKNLGMGPMTMVFRVKDAALLDKAKAGDKARVTIEKVDGALTVTALDVAK